MLHEILQEKEKNRNWDKYLNLYLKLFSSYQFSENTYLREAKQILGKDADPISLRQIGRASCRERV